jgi:hypothetical protein
MAVISRLVDWVNVREGDVTMTQTALRWSGAALVAVGLLTGPMAVLATLEARGQVSFPGSSFLIVTGPGLLIFGLQGVYARHAEATGWLGLVGHVLLTLGTVLLILLASPLLYESPRLRTEGIVTLIALAVALCLGFVLTGLATLRAAVYSRWLGAFLLLMGAVYGLFIVVGPLMPDLVWLLGGVVFGLLLTVTWIWLGVTLWSGAEPTAEYLRPVSGVRA